jgi:adenylate cyclase
VPWIAPPVHLDALVRAAFMTDPETAAGRELLGLLAQARDHGIRDEELVQLAQAYARSVARIVAAESAVTARRLAEGDAGSAEELVDRLQPLAAAAFAALHRQQAVHATRRLLAAPEAPGGVSRSLVAFVDLRGSTRFMLDAASEEVCALVDALFVVGQEVAGRHGVGVGKHLGDGLLLIGADQRAMLDAVDDALRRLAAETPLRAGAGVAHGRVVSRAGDHFGPTVNLASRLAELAAADQVLLAADAVPDASTPGRWEQLRPRGFPGAALVLVHEPAAERAA